MTKRRKICANRPSVTSMAIEPQTYYFGDFTLAAADHRLSRNSTEVELRPKAFDTLLCLVRRQGHTVGKQELLDVVWPGTFVSDAVLTHCIAEVRQALGDDPLAPRYIRTRPKVGYTFVAGVEHDDRTTDTGAAVRGASLKPPASTIAVLPFANLNRDEPNEIFSDGLTEELINTLAQVEGLQVVARTSAFRFKGKTGDARAIGARLGVGTILEGSVRRAHDRLRITAQLINVADGCHLWSEHFDRRTQDVFELQDEIAHGIAEALRIRLAGNRIKPRHDIDPDTYTLYLEGRHHWNKRTPVGFLKAVECFERALVRDAGMAPAWAGLADCYSWMGAFAGMPAEEAARKAKVAALSALEIDSTLAEAHTARGFIAAAYEYDWPGAETCFRRALESNPNHANTHVMYAALVLGPTGRVDEARIHQQRAWELDPLSAIVAGAVATLSVMTRRYDDAISTCRRALDLDPAYPWAYRVLGEAHLLKGQYDEAENALSKIDAPLVVGGFLGYCYAKTSREPQARQLLQRLEEMNNPMLAYQIAVLHLGLGDGDMALDWLRRACDAHAMGVYWLRIEPIWDTLRSKPRFTGLLQRLRLAD
jgi:adenylate cyclase